MFQSCKAHQKAAFFIHSFIPHSLVPSLIFINIVKKYSNCTNDWLTQTLFQKKFTIIDGDNPNYITEL